MKHSLSLAALIVALTASAFALAYEVPLDPRSIREAYFLGQRNNEATQKLLAAYLRRFPLPEKGPHVAEIELLTPYAQAVAISKRKTIGYSAQQAEQEHAERGDTIEVRVLLLFTPTYPLVVESTIAGKRKAPAFRSNDFWKDFKVRLQQEEKEITPVYVEAIPQYSPNLYPWESYFIGTAVYLQYDTRKVKSLPTKFQVVTPDGLQVTADFDLSKLR